MVQIEGRSGRPGSADARLDCILRCAEAPSSSSLLRGGISGLAEDLVIYVNGGRGLHWLSIHFPSRTPSVEVSLPLVIV
ncbi:MAG: hypothetical protein J7L91_03670 [Candidatus Korarchaeota archaeon]|nr:hypothetical protein [Candidatus Korarchaeota archaeon]